MYPKVQELVYAALETMVCNHSEFAVALDENMFAQLLRILLRGLQIKSTSLPCVILRLIPSISK